MRHNNPADSLTAMRRAYQRMTISNVAVEFSGAVLTGSVTSVSIKVDEVTVEDFEQGFGTTASDDFKEIVFD